MHQETDGNASSHGKKNDCCDEVHHIGPSRLPSHQQGTKTCLQAGCNVQGILVIDNQEVVTLPENFWMVKSSGQDVVEVDIIDADEDVVALSFEG